MLKAVSQNAQSGNFRLQKIHWGIILTFSSSFLHYVKLFMNKRWIRVIFVTTRKFLTCGYDCSFPRLFQTVLQKASLYWLVFLERRMSIATLICKGHPRFVSNLVSLCLHSTWWSVLRNIVKWLMWRFADMGLTF